MNYDRVLQLFRSRFANARGFEFYFVGNIDEATLRPLVEQYIASLPRVRKVYTDKGSHEPRPRRAPRHEQEGVQRSYGDAHGYRH